MLGAMGVLLMPIRGFETSVFPSRCTGSESHAHTGRGHSELQVKRKWRFADLGRPPAAKAGTQQGIHRPKARVPQAFLWFLENQTAVISWVNSPNMLACLLHGNLTPAPTGEKNST